MKNYLPFKRQLFALFMMLSAFSVDVFGQSGQTDVVSRPVQLPALVFQPAFYVWLVVASLVFASIVALYRAIRVLTDMLEGSGKSGTDIRPLEEYVRKETAWDRLMKSLTRSVPVDKEEDVLLHHDYDGIRELDNQLPPWWKWGFYLTIVFAFVYLFGYHLSGTGQLQLAEYEQQLADAKAERELLMKNKEQFVTAENVRRLDDQNAIGNGKSVFEKNCAACHKADGGGNVGPNLTDEFWLHGGGISNLFKVITEGVPAKGMISWKSQLSPRQIQEVASFVLTLQGTNPPDSKAPQGELWVMPAVDSTKSVVSTDAVKIVTL